jgi:hypothetical protein
MDKTRQELFELVWSMPMTKLSKQFELSDVGLRKICVKHQIPLPLQGHAFTAFQPAASSVDQR